MADEYELGNVVGKIEFDLPQKELKKLDVATRDMETLDKKVRGLSAMQSSQKGGLPGGGGTDYKLPEKEQKKMDNVSKKAPILEKTFKAFSKGGAAIAAAFGTVALLFGAGNGFRAFFSSLWDMLGVLSDLLFMQVWPILKPLLEFMVVGLKDVAKLLANPGSAITKLATIGDVFTTIWDDAFAMLSDPKMWEALGNTATRTIKSMFSWVVDFMGDSNRWKALFDTLFLIGFTVTKTIVGFLVDPNTWIGLGKVLLAFTVGLGSALYDHGLRMINWGGDMAQGFIDWMRSGIGQLLDLGKQMAQSFIDAIVGFFMNWSIPINMPSVGDIGAGVQNTASGAWNGVTGAWNYVVG